MRLPIGEIVSFSRATMAFCWMTFGRFSCSPSGPSLGRVAVPKHGEFGL
jgi:hypothetical protein